MRDSEYVLAESPFTEFEESELAAELIEVRGTPRFDRFLGGLIQQATRGFGGVGNAPLGRALGGILKGVPRAAFPGGGPGPTSVSPFALEMDGVSGEDEEFEKARRFVRFAGAAARRATRSSSRGSPTGAARAAVVSAARRHAPGLFKRRRRRGSAIDVFNEPTADAVGEPTVDTAGEPAVSQSGEPTIHKCNCARLFGPGRRIVVINL